MSRPRLLGSAHRLALRVAYLGLRVSWRVLRPITIGVRVILIRDGRVLLVRHTYRSGWFLPGGGVKRGETLAAAACREAREEAGVVISSLQLVGMYDNFAGSKSDHIAVFAGTAFEMAGRHDDEIAAVEWFAIDALPADASPDLGRRIAEYLEQSPLRSAAW